MKERKSVSFPEGRHSIMEKKSWDPLPLSLTKTKELKNNQIKQTTKNLRFATYIGSLGGSEGGGEAVASSL